MTRIKANEGAGRSKFSGGVKVAIKSLIRFLFGSAIQTVDQTITNLQAGLDPYDLSAWDAAVVRASETMEQRKSGRNRGPDINVTLRAGADIGVWLHAAEIWQRTRTGHNYGVTVQFEYPQDLPYFDGGYMTRRDA